MSDLYVILRNRDPTAKILSNYFLVLCQTYVIWRNRDPTAKMLPNYFYWQYSTLPRSGYIPWSGCTGTSRYTFCLSRFVRGKYFVWPMLYLKVIWRKFPVDSPLKLEFLLCIFFSTYIWRFNYQNEQKKVPYFFSAIFGVHTLIEYGVPWSSTVYPDLGG